MDIEVAYANPSRQFLLTLAMPSGSSVKQAIEQSGILQLCPEIDLNINKVGIFSEITTLEALLRAGDRIEIYRPLVIDPKSARRKRVKQKLPKAARLREDYLEK
jgi:putative ubiquitin-RnfH superfamily antitoxin RatB of RatAB toxin-antitoxin module